MEARHSARQSSTRPCLTSTQSSPRRSVLRAAISASAPPPSTVSRRPFPFIWRAVPRYIAETPRHVPSSRQPAGLTFLRSLNRKRPWAGDWLALAHMLLTASTVRTPASSSSGAFTKPAVTAPKFVKVISSFDASISARKASIPSHAAASGPLRKPSLASENVRAMPSERGSDLDLATNTFHARALETPRALCHCRFRNSFLPRYCRTLKDSPRGLTSSERICGRFYHDGLHGFVAKQVTTVPFPSS